jgi:type II secretory pathway predicted ATPase ExeA
MASFDLGNRIKGAFGINQRVAAAVNTFAIDTLGYESVALVAQVGAGNTNATINAVLSLRESDDNTVANSTAISADRIIENPVLNAANTAFTVSVAPTKRFLFANVVPSAAFTSNVSVVGILGDAHNEPT